MSAVIRRAQPSDVGRIAEIIVYNNRLNYYPIFQDMEYSFVEYNVIDVAKQFLEDKSFMENCYVYEECAIKGFVCVIDHEIRKLYVDSFFQGSGVGSKLLRYSISELHADHLWALEKNTKALHFYQLHGFRISDEKVYEEGTTEYLVHLFREESRNMDINYGNAEKEIVNAGIEKVKEVLFGTDTEAKEEEALEEAEHLISAYL